MRVPVVVLLGLVACGGASAGGGGAAPPRIPTTPPPEVAEVPAPPTAERFTTSDGWISVEVPSGEGWRCGEEHLEQGELVASWVRCERSDDLYFLAKDYQVTPDQVMPAEELFANHYANNYRRMFLSFDYRQQGRVDVLGASAYEVELEGPREGMGLIRLRERAAVVETHVALLTTHVPADQSDEVQGLVARWFDTTRFEILETARESQLAQSGQPLRPDQSALRRIAMR
ncbi:MAG: hypothetical protein KC731_21410 [Myxococcales bacterium]|nr:hypothetical protein [Myxococcales bacterium]